MSLGSLWTKDAETSYGLILDHLEEAWGPSVTDAFEAEVAHTISLLEVFPDAGVLELSDKRIRSIQVARQVRLFYRHTDEFIIVLEFIDTRSADFQRLR